MPPPPHRSEDVGFTLKEALVSMASKMNDESAKRDREFITINEKQDKQLENQQTMVLAISVLPEMKQNLADITNLVKNPINGIIPRLVSVEAKLGEAVEKKKISKDRNFQFVLAMVGFVAILIGSIIGVIHWVH